MRPEAENLRKLFRVILLSGLLLITLKCFSLLLSQHISLINHPYQVEMREGASLNLTKALAGGINPYLLENQPWYADNFGIMYPLVSLPFANAFGMNLFSLRLTSAVAIFLSMLLVFLALMHRNAGWIYSLSGSVIFYGCVLYYVTPICRADSVGMLFFLAGVIIPVIFRFSGVSLFLGGLFAILAFYTKQYGILGFPVVLSYLFFFVSMRKAVVHALIFLGMLLLTMWLVSENLPCYFYNTTASMAFANPNSFEYSWTQMRLMFVRYLPGLSILALAVLAIRLFHFRSGPIKWSTLKNRFRPNLRVFSKGLWSLSVDPYMWFFFLFFLFLLFKLGGNEGTFMTYHYQLLAFSWIIVAITRASGMINFTWMQVPALGYAVFTATAMITSAEYFKEENRVGWEKARHLISQHQNILNDQTLAAEMIYAGRQLYNSGLTDYYFRSTVNEDFNRMFPFTQQLIDKGNEFRELVRNNIRYKRFELVMLAYPNWIVHDFPMEKYYFKTDSIKLNMYYTNQDWCIYIWRPIADNSLGVRNQ